MDGGLFGGLPAPAETAGGKAQKLAVLQASIQQQLAASMGGSGGSAGEDQGAAKRPRLDLDSALGATAASAESPRRPVERNQGMFGDLPPAKPPRGSPLAMADGRSPWLGTPWIGGKSPWGPASTDADVGGAVSPGPHGVDTSGSMIGLEEPSPRAAAAAASSAPGLRRVRLQKSASGFGLNVSASATVFSFNAEPDGRPGPAAAAGVLEGERIVEVNGSSVADKAGLLAELKKLKANGVNALEFGLLQPPAASTEQPAAAGAGGLPVAGAAPPSAPRSAGAPNTGAAEAEAGWGEFGEEKDDHFVLGPGVTTMRDGRYTQLAPLGKGTFARVIGAIDSGVGGAGAAGGERLKVAIKCLRRAEHVCATGRHELRTLQLVNSDSADMSQTHCIRLLDNFLDSGHLMLVFPRQDRNLRMALQASPEPGGVPLDSVRTYGKQMLIALRYLCKLNLVHNDIKLDNFLLTEKTSRFDGKLRKSTVILCDFGNASKPQPTVETPYIMARLYRAPELILGVSHGLPVDMWGLACCLFELATRRFLFPGSDSNHTLRAMQEVLGPVPTQMAQQGAFASKHFDLATGLFLDRSGGGGSRGGAAPPTPGLPRTASGGKPTRFERPSSSSAGNKLLTKLCPKEARLAMGAAELQVLEQLRDVLGGMLVFEPANRMTAAGAILRPFFAEASK